MEGTPCIHLEGLDLSGKTSVALRMLERYPTWERRYTTLMSDIRENPFLMEADVLNNSEKPDQGTLFQLYKNAALYDTKHVPKRENPLIQDSTIIIRTLAGLSVSQVYNTTLEEEIVACADGYPSFDVSIVLTCSQTERLRRLNIRRENLGLGERLVKDDLLIECDPDAFFRKEKALIDYSKQLFSSEILDTTHMSIDEVCNYIVKKTT